MTTTTAQTTHPVTVGQGTSVHIGIDAENDGHVYTACGAEGRGYRQSRIRKAQPDAMVTCPRCMKSTWA